MCSNVTKKSLKFFSKSETVFNFINFLLLTSCAILLVQRPLTLYLQLSLQKIRIFQFFLLGFFIQPNQIKMAKQRGKIGKYSKISLQKKYQLLKLTQFGKMNLKETSQHLRINYSTAKTIFFQYQNDKIKNRLKFFKGDTQNKDPQNKTQIDLKMAICKKKVVIEKGASKINLICTSKCFRNRWSDKMLGQSVRNREQLEIEQKQIIGLENANKNVRMIGESQQIVNNRIQNIIIPQIIGNEQSSQKLENRYGGNSLQQALKQEKSFSGQICLNMNPLIYCYSPLQYPYCYFFS